jgi:hypothetical protein
MGHPNWAGYDIAVQDLGLLLVVLGSKLQLMVLPLVYSVGYRAQTRKHAASTKNVPAELDERINRKRRNNYYLWDIGKWIDGNRPGEDVVKFGIDLE